MRTIVLALAFVTVIGALLAGVRCAPRAGNLRPIAPIGKVLRVTGSVTLEHKNAALVQVGLTPGNPLQAKVDELVYQDDVIASGPDGKAGIAFVDGTSFDISPNSRMELNEFVYNPAGKNNSTLINLTKGTFTFIAGQVAHTGSMKVQTPVATMGIRGTAPRVQILDDGSVRFSTLVEEHKKTTTEGFSSRSPVMRASTPIGRQPAPIVVEKANKKWRRLSRLCRNC